MSLFAELKRRRVFRLMAVYGAVAFGVLQAADVLIPALHLPESMITAIAALALLGFPLAIVLAWAFESTPDGVRRTEPAARGELEAMVRDLRLATANLKAFTESIKERPSALVRGSKGPDRKPGQGVDR